jgi:hypothetical protein
MKAVATAINHAENRSGARLSESVATGIFILGFPKHGEYTPAAMLLIP